MGWENVSMFVRLFFGGWKRVEMEWRRIGGNEEGRRKEKEGDVKRRDKDGR